MSDAPMREWRFYLNDMIGFAEKVSVYTDGLDQAGFVASGMNYEATVRNLESIGEAATNIPVEIRQQCPQIPWPMVVATRNKLIHGYLGIADDTMWSIIQTDVPALLAELHKMKKVFPN
jgi:uncharacterized protein with HEPN domain